MINLNQYKNGKVSKEELEEFTNAFMRAKYDEDRRNRWQQMLGQNHDLQRTGAAQPTSRGGRRIALWATSAAAAVVLAAAIWFLWPNNPVNTYEQLADNYLTEEFYENREDSRGEQDVEQINLQAIFAYNQKDFATAIERYEVIVNSGQANDRHHFFLGLSYLYTDKYEAAIRNLQRVPEIDERSKFLMEHRWFLALAYLKNAQIAEGRAVLLSITPGDWKYQEAQRLLEAISQR